MRALVLLILFILCIVAWKWFLWAVATAFVWQVVHYAVREAFYQARKGQHNGKS